MRPPPPEASGGGPRTRRRCLPLLPAAVVLFLAACVEPIPGDEAAQVSPPTPNAHAVTPSVASAPEPELAPRPAPPPAPRLRSPLASPDTHVSVDTNRLPGPDFLLGMTRDGVRELLGRPGFIRRDGTAVLLQYRGATCILDIFLYKDPATAAVTVTHVEVRGRNVLNQPRQECFLGLLGKREKKNPGPG